MSRWSSQTSSFSSSRERTPFPASGCEDPAMNAEYALGLVLSVLLTAYLVYALIRPERF